MKLNKKCALYSASRERIGAIVAIFYANVEKPYAKWKQEAEVIENDLSINQRISTNWQ